MKHEITLPVLSDTMITGRLARWLKQPGEKINKGDVIAEMESDKAIMEVEAFHSGFLAGPLAPIDTDIPVKQIIGYIVDEPEVSSAATEQPKQKDSSDTSKESDETVATVKNIPVTGPTQTAATAPTPPQPNLAIPKTCLPVPGKRIASPHARALALKLGIDLSHVPPGKDGRILAEDVLNVSHRMPTLNLEAGPPYRLKKMTLMQQTVAANMIATSATPTFRTTAQLSLEALKKLAKRQQFSLTLLLAVACAKTITALPQFNAVYTPEGMAHRDRVDIGIAVDVPGGLLTPVLRDAAERPLDELAEDWRILKDKIKRQRLTQQDYEGATFYLSNLGVFSVVHSFDALVPLGAAAILAIGAEHYGHCLFTLSCDHRVLSGADSARFLTTLHERLQQPEELLD
jgi:pyruvate dehydrogenase E2 component (dihydrolipoyllysine-residue acetyltransferase)